MSVNRAIRYKAYPDAEQATLFCKTIGCCRKLYNTLLAWKKEDDRLYNETHGQHQHGKLPLVTWVKQQFNYMNEVDSLALMNARRHLETAFKNYIESCTGKRNGRKSGYPKFKKRGKDKDSYTTNCVSGNISVGYKYIKLPKVGKVKANIHRRLPSDAKIDSVTVTHERNGEWYISIAYRCEITLAERHSETLRVVGLDMSMEHFVVSSDDTDDAAKTKYIRQYRKVEKRRSRLARRMSRKVKGSNNRMKAKLLLANLDRKIADRRTDYCHKTSRYFARKYDVIVIEELDMQEMSRTLHLGKSVMDLGWGRFRDMLKYKCIEEGSELVIADKWFASSKTCHECGCKNPELKLSDRVWVCPHCGCVLDRDRNAALNLMDYYFKNTDTAGTAGINACGDSTSTSQVTVGQVLSGKQEATKSLV